jgi:lipopolysaccharide/colanic/teichoic acid biosynthesis glycosyltransferase
MSQLIALSGMERSRNGLAPSTNDGQVAAVSDVDRDNLPEVVRALVGSGCVKQLVLRGETRPQILAAAVEAAREAGRGVKFVASSPLHQLPPANEGENWLRVETAGEFSCSLVPRQHAIWKLAVKRLMDVVVAATLLVVLLPVLVVIGIAVKLASPGPILYPWRVLGEHGRPFVGYKFRTMVRDADALKPQLQHLNERSGPVFKIAKDPRVTPLGRWLRKHSLDELPQLWSVLIGDMSLVGPRPPSASEYKEFELWQMRKLSVKPGVTCLWQVDGRSTITEFSEWARLDLRYIDTWSLWKDIVILLRTPIVVVKGTGY